MNSFGKPVTVKQLIQELQTMIDLSNGELTGEEYILSSGMIHDSEERPPNTLILKISKEPFDPQCVYTLEFSSDFQENRYLM